MVYLLLENDNHSVSRGKLLAGLLVRHRSGPCFHELAPEPGAHPQIPGTVRIEPCPGRRNLRLSEPVAGASPSCSASICSTIINYARKGDIESVLGLCDLYAGDLLAQNEPQNSDFDEWLDVERVRLRDDLITMLLGMVNKPVGVSIDEKRQCARKLIEIDPYQEVGYRTLMQTASQLGLIAKVERTFRECTKKLRDDLDVEPEEETIELYQQLLPKLSPATTRGLIIPAQPAQPVNVAMAWKSSCPVVDPRSDPD